MAGYSADGDFNPGNYDNKKLSLWLSKDIKPMPPPIPDWKKHTVMRKKHRQPGLYHKDKWSSYSREQQKAGSWRRRFYKLNLSAGAQTFLAPMVLEALANPDKDISAKAQENVNAILTAVRERNLNSLHANISDRGRVMVKPYMLVNLSAQFTELNAEYVSGSLHTSRCYGFKAEHYHKAQSYITPQDVEDDQSSRRRFSRREVSIKFTVSLGMNMDQYSR